MVMDAKVKLLLVRPVVLLRHSRDQRSREFKEYEC